VTERSALVVVGHNGPERYAVGPRRAAWWREPDGFLFDEFELAQRVAIVTAFELDARGWRVAVCSTPKAYPEHLYEKGRALDQWRPSIGLAVHFNVFSRERDRRGGWPGAESGVFGAGHVPVETDRASGTSVVVWDGSEPARDFARIAVRKVDENTGLRLALGDGIDERTIDGPDRVWILTRVQPGRRRKRFPTPGWDGCPVVVLEVAVLSHPRDRGIVRGDPHFFSKVGAAYGAACDEWLAAVRREEADAR